MKNDAGKARMDLLPFDALLAVAEVLEFGSRKYPPGSWRDVDAQRCLGAMLRHLAAWQLGEELDDESGLSHVAHMACNALFICSKVGLRVAQTHKEDTVKKAVKKAMDHPDKLGAGAKKRKALKPEDKVEAVMAEYERGTLHSGSGEKVTNRKQAVAIAISERDRAKKKKRAK